MTKKKLKSKDGYPIAVTSFFPEGDPRAVILISGATAVPQKFYKDFAEFVCKQGHVVVSFDFRGIGESKPQSFKKFKCDFYDWVLDYSCVFEGVLKLDLPVLVVGHSFGALVFGDHKRTNETVGLYGFGAGSGYSGFLTLKEKIKTKFMWHFIGPITIGIFGYIPQKFSGMGADIPKDLFYQWRKWCVQKRFWFGDKDFKLKENFNSIRTPIKVVVSADDSWTSLKASRDYFDNLKDAEVEYELIEPLKKPIGHFNYFKKESGGHLWADVLQWLEDKITK